MKKFYAIILFIFIIIEIQQAKAQYTKLYDFAGIPDGIEPRGSLFFDGTFLYGMTSIGGSNLDGTVFKIMPNGSGYSKFLNFNGVPTGRYPQGSFISDGTFLYGVTEHGGTSDSGVAFKIMPNGSSYSKLINFIGATNGSNPCGSLLYDGTFLYGMTSSGGANNYGTIFKVMPNGSGYVKLMDFAGASNGKNPFGSLAYDGTSLYGMALSGGTNNMGLIFKIMPNGTGYTKLLDFAGTANGSSPYGSLIYDGTFLYGMTKKGGTNDSGTVFKIMPNGSSYTKLLDFTGITNGSFPVGDLMYDGTFLYGMTSYGGINNLGTIFKIMINGSGFVKLLDFDGVTKGQWPSSALISDGNFLYGMASSGGINGYGVVFKLSLVVGIEQITAGNTGVNIFPNPTSDQFFIVANTTDKLIVDLYDVSGRHVCSKITSNKETIDVSTLNEGVYTLKIKTAEGLISKKLVIVR